MKIKDCAEKKIKKVVSDFTSEVHEVVKIAIKFGVTKLDRERTRLKIKEVLHEFTSKEEANK